MSNPIPDSANPKDLAARKKVPLWLVPPALAIGAAEGLADGAKKYGPYNYRDIPVQYSVYIEAIERHIAALKDGEDLAQDSQIHHVKHIAAGCAIILDCLGLGNLIDDRKLGPGAKLLAEAHQRRADCSDDCPPVDNQQSAQGFEQFSNLPPQSLPPVNKTVVWQPTPGKKKTLSPIL
jgi:hypothetical protein